MLLVAARVHLRCIQSFVVWVRQYCGTSEVFVLHVLRCALFLASALVAWAARAETHVAAKKKVEITWVLEKILAPRVPQKVLARRSKRTNAEIKCFKERK